MNDTPYTPTGKAALLLDKLRSMISDHVPAAALQNTLDALDEYTAAVYEDGKAAATDGE